MGLSEPTLLPSCSDRPDGSSDSFFFVVARVDDQPFIYSMNFKSTFIMLAAAPLALAEYRPDAFAPIGVMGEHLHAKDQFMASYRYMNMRMEQNFVGTGSVSDGSVLADFMVAPADMDMEMHMVGFMYAPTDKFTLMAMVNIVELSMNHHRRDGLEFKTKSSGIGDSSINALLGLWEDNGGSLHAGLGILLPTAEVDEQDFIPGPGETRLPYPMQLGSGSWGIAPSLTFKQHHGNWSFGAQTSAKIFLDDNDEGYRLGNKFEFTTWAAAPINEQFSVSIRSTFSGWGNINGEDNDLLSLPVPTADPNLRGGSKLDLSLGLNFFESGTKTSAGLEIGKTIWQDLDGPQLGSDYWITAGIRFSW
ncbi:MAG: hypothetical protein CMO60_09395 [Verrucomicrobiales bacterium]|nr:hypothetical protein [Verrucomicrobiales bacterium]